MTASRSYSILRFPAYLLILADHFGDNITCARKSLVNVYYIFGEILLRLILRRSGHLFKQPQGKRFRAFLTRNRSSSSFS
ncbi:MAG: hypothetical protein MZV63_29205 [Marinilabiliales bacterium]|nr:hypothetical protein [Marinilabiliales bacterium]